MVIKISILLNAFILFTHPLESIALSGYDLNLIPCEYTDGKTYVAPSDGLIKSIIHTNNTYQVIFALANGTEIIYSGVSGIVKKQGEYVKAGEIIAEDTSISTTTKFIIMLCDLSDSYPQFENNKLIFIVNPGTKVHAVADGEDIQHGFNTNYGYFTQYELKNYSNYLVTYMYLSAFYKQNRSTVSSGEFIVASGNTGDSKEPCLSLEVGNFTKKETMKVIYVRVPKNPEQHTKK